MNLAAKCPNGLPFNRLIVLGSTLAVLCIFGCVTIKSGPSDPCPPFNVKINGVYDRSTEICQTQNKIADNLYYVNH